jgi:hypothetical protein
VPLSLRRDADEARVCRDRRPNSVPDPDPLDRCSVSQTGWDNVLPAPFAWGEDPDGGGRPTGRAEGRRKLISARQRRSARTLIRGWADRTRQASRGPGSGPADPANAAGASLGEGKRSVDAAVDQLEAAGYLIVIRTRGGRYTPCRYIASLPTSHPLRRWFDSNDADRRSTSQHPRP